MKARLVVLLLILLAGLAVPPWPVAASTEYRAPASPVGTVAQRYWLGTQYGTWIISAAGLHAGITPSAAKLRRPRRAGFQREVGFP